MSRIYTPTKDVDVLAWAQSVAPRFVTGSFTWDAPAAAANGTTTTVLSDLSIYPELKGLRAGMPVSLTPPGTIDNGLMVNAWIPADNQLAIRAANLTGSSIDQGSGTWAFISFLL